MHTNKVNREKINFLMALGLAQKVRVQAKLTLNILFTEVDASLEKDIGS